MKIAIIDGYVDEPACLGVPPFLSPYPRYLAGSLIKGGIEDPVYITIDQIRDLLRGEPQQHQKQTTLSNLKEIDVFFILAGVSVPGKYIGGHPINLNDIRNLYELFNNTTRVLFGPSTDFGLGIEGGKPPLDISVIEPYVHFIVHGDAHFTIDHFISNRDLNLKTMIKQADGKHIFFNCNDSIEERMEKLSEFAKQGARIIPQHPNYGKNLICEIETYKGCPRYRTGGCSFCTETQKGSTTFRQKNHIIDEIKELAKFGCTHIRLGNQTDFYAYMHGEYEHERYPKPNPSIIKSLLREIREQAPNLQTLHIDNVNALNFALYEPEAIEITKAIVQYCTDGNTAAIGIESVDPDVIKKNNLKVNQEEAMKAIQIINNYGAEHGPNGSPKYLPGLNFILGLPSETPQSLQLNRTFLLKMLEKGLLVRRINIRKIMAPKSRVFSKELSKNAKLYDKWKEEIRQNIDYPMLKLCFPFGTVLKSCYFEYSQGNGSYLRQAGTYPILIYCPELLSAEKTHNIVVLDHGFRSLVGMSFPVDLFSLSMKQLETIPGIGKNTATKIKLLQKDDKEGLKSLIGAELYKHLTGNN